MVYLMIVLASVYANLNEHTLGPYMNSTSIDKYMQNLTEQNSTILTFNSNSDPKYVILDKNPPDSTYKRGLVLFVGSLHGGSPLSAYTVLSYLEQCVNDYNLNSKIQEIVDNNTLIFMPIANYPAYKLVEETYNTSKTFITVLSGLEYLDECTNTDNSTEFYPGIDPDQNFNSGFQASDDKCNSLGTAGSSASLSNITKKITDLISHPSPLVFIFAEEGNVVYKPYAKNKTELTGKVKNYYELIADHVDKDFKFESFSNNKTKNGSLIDYVPDNGGLAFEIWGEKNSKVTEENVGDKANATFEFVYNAIRHSSLDVKVGFRSNDYSGEKCVNYSMCFDVSFYIEAQTFTDVLADIDVMFEFNTTNFTLYSLNVTKLNFDKTTQDGSRIECLITNTSLKCKEYKVEGYTLVNFIFQFGFSSSDKINASYTGLVTASKSSVYFSDGTFSDSGPLPGFNDDDSSSSSSSSSSDGDHKRRPQRGVMVGLVLLIVLLILLIIAGVILCCTQHKKEEPAGQFAAGNVA